MATVPAYCPSCGLTFAPRLINIAGSASVTLSNNFTNCPRCGGMAKFVDGTLSEKGGRLVAKNAPPLTHAILESLNRILDEARTSASSSEQLLKEIEQASPPIAAILKPLLKHRTPAFVIAIFYLMLQALHININLDLNKLFDQVVKVAESSEGAVRAPQTVNVNQTIVNVIQSRSQSRTTLEQRRHRLRQPQLRPKKQQGKFGPRWRRKRRHRFV